MSQTWPMNWRGLSEPSGARRVKGGLVAVLVGWCCAGCAPTDPLDAWAGRVQQYVQKQGNGDPLVLRDSATWTSARALRPAELKVGALDASGGDVLSAESEDVIGVYVGMAAAGGRPWMFFLVGVNLRDARPEEVSDVRLAGFRLADDPAQWEWVFSPPNARTAARYRVRASPAALAPNVSSRGVACFPDPLDVYEFKASGGSVSVVERRSGAQWMVRLPRAAPPAAANAVAPLRAARPQPSASPGAGAPR